MFTVIVLSRAHQQVFDKWRELFAPFLDTDKMRICEWSHNGGERDLDEAIPDLADAIKGKREWRLLAIGTGTEDLVGAFRSDPENPFDYEPNWPSNDGDSETLLRLKLEDSPYPLVRLSHMLLGYPEMGASSFVPDISYWDPQNRQRVSEAEFIAGRVSHGVSAERAHEEFIAALPTRDDVQTRYRPDALNEDDDRRYRVLIEKYSVRQSAPAEVVFLAQRDPRPNRPTDDLKAAWSQGDGITPSQFVARNDYHPACRFVVVDLQQQDASAVDLAEMRFWLCVLSLAINDLPASAFQAERLYRMSVDLDAELFGHILNNHMGELSSLRERLEAELRKPRNTVRMEIDQILDRTPIPVSFDNLDGDDLKVSTEGYGLASDRPTSEVVRWNSAYADLHATAEDFKRRPRRVLAKAVESARNRPEHVEIPDVPLGEIERDELEEELSLYIRRLTDATTKDILDRERLSALIDQHDRDIRHAIRERMSLWTIVLSALIVGFVWVAVFVPFVIAALRSDGIALTESLFVVLGVAGALIGVGVGALVWMRRALLSRLYRLNDDLDEYVEGVKSRASAFGEFLTDVYTYKRGRAYLRADADRDAGERRRRGAFQRDLQRIREVIDREKSLVRSVGEQIEIRRVTNIPINFAQWNEGALRTILCLPMSERECSFNRSGDVVQTAYAFVQRINLVNLHLPEDVDRYERIRRAATTVTTGIGAW